MVHRIGTTHQDAKMPSSLAAKVLKDTLKSGTALLDVAAREISK